MRKPWTEIDGDAPRPGLTELTTSQQRIRFRPTSVTSVAADELLRQFRLILDNGGAHLATFTVEDLDDAGEWFLSRNHFEEYEFVQCLIASDGLSEALPMVVEGGVNRQVRFSYSSPLTLDGDLAAQLTWGGAYTSFGAGGAVAKRIGAAFSADVIGDRYEDFRIDHTHESWSPWFFDVAWDRTWVITDRRDQRVTLLCLTDTD